MAVEGTCLEVQLLSLNEGDQRQIASNRVDRLIAYSIEVREACRQASMTVLTDFGLKCDAGVSALKARQAAILSSVTLACPACGRNLAQFQVAGPGQYRFQCGCGKWKCRLGLQGVERPRVLDFCIHPFNVLSGKPPTRRYSSDGGEAKLERIEQGLARIEANRASIPRPPVLNFVPDSIKELRPGIDYLASLKAYGVDAQAPPEPDLSDQACQHPLQGLLVSRVAMIRRGAPPY